MNLPNTITIGRFVLAALLFAVLSWHLGVGDENPDLGDTLLVIALVVFVVAALTDWLDGFVARRLGLTTAFGRITDPLADKIIVCGTFTYFLPIGSKTCVEPWMVVVILARELLVTAVRAHIEAGGKAFGALVWGKAKMWVQSATIITILVYLRYFEGGGKSWPIIVVQLGVYGTVIATVGSCFPYIRRAWKDVES